MGKFILIGVWKKIGESYKLQPSVLKQEMEHDEIYEDTWGEKENEWLPGAKNDVLSTALCYARYAIGMEELTGFGMKNSLTLPSLINKKFNSLRDENDEPTYTYTDPFKRKFVRQSIEWGSCNAFNQHYKSEVSDELFNNLPKELKVNGNIHEILEKFFKYDKQHAEEFDSKYNDYKDIDQGGKTDYINK